MDCLYQQKINIHSSGPAPIPSLAGRRGASNAVFDTRMWRRLRRKTGGKHPDETHHVFVCVKRFIRSRLIFPLRVLVRKQQNFWFIHLCNIF
jgi:hypothetical protein